MQSAFRNLCMKPSQYCLLVMYAISPFDGRKYYFCDKCLPFGASISCSHFQRFSNAVAHATKVVTHKTPINYLDDYLFCVFLKALCNQQVDAFLSICARINFPVSLDKTFWATETLVFLSLLIDTIRRLICLPVDKVTNAKTLIQQILNKKSRKVTVHKLQKLCGFLNFICKCIVPGRPFTRKLYTFFSSSMSPHFHVHVNGEMKADLEMWLKFLEEPSIYCRPFMDFSEELSADKLDFFTDTSGKIGLGGINESEYFHARWDETFLMKCKPSIEYLELAAVTAGVLLWVKKYQNRRICIFVDNESVKYMINDSTTSCKNYMVLICLIVLECMAWNVRLFAEHVSSSNNNFADALSRGDLPRFWADAKKAEKQFDKFPLPIPSTMWPIQKL